MNSKEMLLFIWCQSRILPHAKQFTASCIGIRNGGSSSMLHVWPEAQNRFLSSTHLSIISVGQFSVWVSCTCYHLLSITSNSVVICFDKNDDVLCIEHDIQNNIWSLWEASELALKNRDTSFEVSHPIVDLAGSCFPIRPLMPIVHWTVNVFWQRIHSLIMTDI